MLVLLACVTGVSLVLERGMRLDAPPDLSGEWEVHAEDGTQLGGRVLVEQSGRFVRLNFDGGLSVDVKLAADADIRPVDSRAGGLELQYEGKSWKLGVTGHNEAGPLTCQLIGPHPERHAFILMRPAGVATARRPPLPAMTQTADAEDVLDVDLAPAVSSDAP
jgi:hypothetical protein